MLLSGVEGSVRGESAGLRGGEFSEISEGEREGGDGRWGFLANVCDLCRIFLGLFFFFFRSLPWHGYPSLVVGRCYSDMGDARERVQGNDPRRDVRRDVWSSSVVVFSLNL